MKKLFSILILSAPLMFLGGYGEFNKGEFQLKTPTEIIRDWGAERAAKFINEVSETE